MHAHLHEPIMDHTPVERTFGREYGRHRIAQVVIGAPMLRLLLRSSLRALCVLEIPQGCNEGTMPFLDLAFLRLQPTGSPP